MQPTFQAANKENHRTLKYGDFIFMRPGISPCHFYKAYAG